MTPRAERRRPWVRSIALVGVLAACAERPTFERVDRLELPGAPALAPVEVGGETRLAARVSAPHAVELCLDGAGAVEVGVAAPGADLALRLAAGSAERAATAPAKGWTDLRLELPGGTSCARLEIEGPPGAEAALARPLALARGPRRPWAVLYVIDTLRFDATPYGDDGGAAGAWGRLAEDGVVYRRAIASSSWTRPTAATLLTGLGPSSHRVFDRQDRLAAGIPRLPEWLAAAGYATAAVSTNPHVLPAWGFLGGFDRFIDVDVEAWGGPGEFERLDRALREIAASMSDRPLFLYVHDNEPHYPYLPGPRHRRRFGAPPAGSRAEAPSDARDAEQVAGARRLYAAEVAATAERLDGLIDTLERLGLYRDAVIAVAGDHGEEFAEHGGLYHGRTLYQEQLHVPLVLKAPGPPGAVDAPVSTEDVAPALLDRLGLPLPVSVAGRRLPRAGGAPSPSTQLAELRVDDVELEAALRWPLKYVREAGGAERLFDLDADPSESVDLAPARADATAALRRAVDARRAAAARGLGVSCVAGARPARVRVDVEAPAGATVEVDELGLEGADTVAARPGGVWAELALRPAGSASSGGRLPDTAGLARAQPDRDGLRVRGLEPERATIALAGAGSTLVGVEGPDAEPLPAGAAIPLSRVLAAAAPREPDAGAGPRCRIHFLAAARDRTAGEDLDPGLRKRLRGLGYLD